MTIRYIGLDFETSGSEPWGKHVPIQVGMALETDGGESPYSFESLIGGWDWKQYEWSSEAYEVHKIGQLEVDAAPPVWAVDIQAASWVINFLGYTNRMFNITVGWNVAGFDRQFVTRWMPNLNRLLSYRTLDLNALVFAKSNTEQGFKAFKTQAKVYADGVLGPDGHHNALRDAKAALLEMNYLIAPTGVPE